LKMLRVVKRIKDTTRLTIKATLLGAHAIPKEYVNRQEYIDLVINEMIPAVAEENLADYCDVFCEKNFFTPEETERVLEQGLKYGLKPKIHANQLSISGGVQVGVKMNAISVDHLECMGEEEIEVLKGSTVMPTALPGAAFFLNMSFPPARQIITAGLPLAVATDYNPGSSPCGNMPFMLSLACIKMRMTPEEAINATTLNTAYAMEINHNHGTIAKGKIANIFITKEIPSYSFIPYAFSSNLIETVILQGQLISED
jgi:imidazolonepropionase